MGVDERVYERWVWTRDGCGRKESNTEMGVDEKILSSTPISLGREMGASTPISLVIAYRPREMGVDEALTDAGYRAHYRSGCHVFGPGPNRRPRRTLYMRVIGKVKVLSIDGEAVQKLWCMLIQSSNILRALRERLLGNYHIRAKLRAIGRPSGSTGPNRHILRQRQGAAKKL